MLEEWLRSYRPDELFDERGHARRPSSRRSRPQGDLRMSANPHANGGVLLRDLVAARLPRLRRRGEGPGTTTSEATRVLGAFLRDVIERNPENFRLFGPDETASNRLGDVFSVTERHGRPRPLPTDERPRAATAG